MSLLTIKIKKTDSIRCRRIWVFLPLVFLAASCYRKDIEFGDTPENGYTRLVYIDSVGVALSSVVTDSFVTNNAQSFLVGSYQDPYLGKISTAPFFQVTVPPGDYSISSNSHYDSLQLIVHLNHYFYGDTSNTPALSVYELDQPIAYTYASGIYNTSQVSVKNTPLGTLHYRIRPSVDDSLRIRLDDTKGAELFEKLKNHANEVSSEDNFLNYFRGLSLSLDPRDTLAVYGLEGAAGTIVMRLYYHNSIPYTENLNIDFPSLANSYSFNQVKAGRSGTLIYTSNSDLTEIPAAQTNHESYVQGGTGVITKITFPSLKGIIENDHIVKLLSARLVIRPVRSTFDLYRFKLPDSLYLAKTDASNVAGAPVYDATGSVVQYASPFIDEIYGKNSNYSFDITSYINSFLNTDGSTHDGFFLLQKESADTRKVDRAVLGDSQHPSYKSELQLTVAVIEN